MTKRPYIFSLMLSVTLIFPQNVNAETIRETVRNALSAHPSIEAAQAGKDVSLFDGKEARSGLFPQISTNLSAGRVYADTSTSRGLTSTRGAAYSWMGEGNASITQPIFDGRETLSRMGAATAREQAADYNIVDVQQNLSFQAVQAHLAIMQAQATIEKTQSYYDVIDSYQERIQMMVDEGVADQSEMAQAQNISLMLESALIDHKGQLNAAYAGYQEIVGYLPKSDLVKPSLSDFDVREDVEMAIRHTKANHPLIKQGLENLNAAKHDVQTEKAGYYPDLDGEMSYLKKDQDEEIGGEVIDARALLRMSWDFELGGAQKARTQRSKAQYSEILAQNRETVRVIEGGIRRAYTEHETAIKQMDLVKQREVVTKELFDAYETQFEGARVRLLQLMQAENQLFNAQLESITAEYRYLLAQYAIAASTGQLLDVVDGEKLNVGSSDVYTSKDVSLVDDELTVIDTSYERVITGVSK